jgi:outer membrane cobalamin receptor
LNAEFSSKLHEKVEFRVGVRNLLDMHYRVFASGISAAGRGVYTSLHTAF